MGESVGKQLGTKADDPESSNQLAQIGLQLFQESTPLRQGLINNSTQFLQGGFNPASSPAFQAQNASINTSFDSARDRVLGSLPTGGGLTESLVNLEGQRALALTGAKGDVYNQELARAFSLATGAPLQGALGGLGGAANIQSQLAAQNAANTSNKIGSSKQGAGQVAGAAALAGG